MKSQDEILAGMKKESQGMKEVVDLLGLIDQGMKLQDEKCVHALLRAWFVVT